MQETLTFQEMASESNGSGLLIDDVKILELGVHESEGSAYDYELVNPDGGAFSLDASWVTQDNDNSEYSVLTLSGMPTGFTVSDGNLSVVSTGVDHTIDLFRFDLSALQITPNSDQAFVLTFTATQTERGNADSATTVKTLHVNDGNHAPIIDAPMPELHFTLDGVDAATTAVTESIQGLNGSNVGTLAAGTGDSKVGTHAQFDGSNEILVANTDLPTAADAVTVSFWMNWDGTDNVMPIAFNQYDLELNGGNFGFGTFNSDTWGSTIATLDLGTDASLAGNWHHVTAVFHDQDIQANALYINGIKQQLSLVQGTDHTLANQDIHQALTIGGTQASAGFGFTGGLDDVQVFHRAVTDQEAFKLALADAPSNFNMELVHEGTFDVDPSSWTFSGTAEFDNGNLVFGYMDNLTDGVAEYTFSSEKNVQHELSFDFWRVGQSPEVILKVEVIDVNSGDVIYTQDAQTGATTNETNTQDFTTISEGDVLVRFSDLSGTLGVHNTDVRLDNVSIKALAYAVDELASGLSPDSLNGTEVFTVEGYDRNEHDVLTYTLTDNAGGRFAIDSTTGQVTVADASLLDYETDTSHSVTVTVSDGVMENALDYQINLQDVDEGAGGQDYQVTLSNDEQTLSLLEPVTTDEEVYYWLDVNQDDALTEADKIDYAELASIMDSGTNLIFDEASIALVGEVEVADLQVAETIADVPVWSVDNQSGEYTLGSFDDNQTQGYVIYQIIG